MKTSGKVWKDYLESWPDGQWFDDDFVIVNGKEDSDVDIQDSDVVEVKFGTIYTSEKDKTGLGLVSHFKKWLKLQDSKTYLVTVENKSTAAFEDFVKKLGAKIG